MQSTDIHRAVVTRLAVVWLALSFAFGAAGLVLEMDKADAWMLDVARKESRAVSEHMQFEDISHLQELRFRVDQILETGFVAVRVYNAARNLILEAAKPGDAGLPQIAPHVHPLAPGDRAHFHTYWSAGWPVMQLLLPIERSGSLVGYFEGVHRPDAATVNAIKTSVVRTLALVLATTLATSVVLYPVIVSLNKGVVALSRNLVGSNVELMRVLGSAVALRDSETYVHNHRVTLFAVRLAEAAGVAANRIRPLIAGAFLHDVGKIGISDSILLKPGPLSAEEFAKIATHVDLGVAIVSKSAWLRGAREVVEFHHEKFDGGGYRKGLKGEAIPLNARIFAIADVFDALTSRRPYKNPYSFDEAMALMRQGRGSHFDPRLLDSFCSIAADLHAQVSHAPDAELEESLHDLVSKYFAAEGGADARIAA